MKKVEAIIRPEKLAVLRQALQDAGSRGMTISDVKGHGTQRGVTETYRGVTYTVDLLPKVKIELVLPDDKVAAILKVIRDAAGTGQVGDGKVFVWTIDEVMRVRTGETGDAAL